MSEAYFGEIRLFPYNYTPYGWLPCEGQQLQAQQYQVLYALIANLYGPATQTTFYLPDLRGRAAMGATPSNRPGQSQGNAGITLSFNQLPAHSHQFVANVYIGTSNTPANNLRLSSDSAANFMTYKLSPSSQPVQMAANSLLPNGQTPAQPHENRQPFLAMQFCICYDGIWPEKPD